MLSFISSNVLFSIGRTCLFVFLWEFQGPEPFGSGRCRAWRGACGVFTPAFASREQMF